ncbi:MAG: DinB family protein [Saprospiraceae bacterium]|nr:DinB family protein [Saprospiraceae bacterium]MDW8229731.1 DinB family protein [Saprospiraceae bacterium]
MYRKIQDFLEEWQQEFEATKDLVASIREEDLDFSPGDKIRPIRDLIWHIVGTPGTLMTEMGETNNMVNWHGKQVETLEGLVSAYDRANEELVSIVSRWTDEELNTSVSVLDGEYRKGYVLSSLLIGHQAHHRGQLTVLMRMKNRRVTALYGPTYETWLDMGEEPMK